MKFILALAILATTALTRRNHFAAGIYLSTQEIAALTEPDMEKLADLLTKSKFNNIYADIYSEGRFYAKSKTYEDLFGAEPDYLGKLVNSPALKYFYINPTFSHGNRASKGGSDDTPLAAFGKKRGWVLDEGKTLFDGYTWFDPGNPEYLSFMKDVMEEITDETKNGYSKMRNCYFTGNLAYPDSLPLTKYSQDRKKVLYDFIDRNMYYSARGEDINYYGVEEFRDRGVDTPYLSHSAAYFLGKAVVEPESSDIATFKSQLIAASEGFLDSQYVVSISCETKEGPLSLDKINNLIAFTESSEYMGLIIKGQKCFTDIYESAGESKKQKKRKWFNIFD